MQHYSFSLILFFTIVEGYIFQSHKVQLTREKCIQNLKIIHLTNRVSQLADFVHLNILLVSSVPTNEFQVCFMLI